MTRREDALRVFEEWRKRRPDPKRCRFTLDRERMLLARLRLGYTVEELISIVEYIYEGDDDDPKWMRGEHPRNSKAHLDLENLLRVQRLAARVEAASLWKDGIKQAKERTTTVSDRVPFRLVPGSAIQSQAATVLPTPPAPITGAASALPQIILKVKRE